MKKKSVLDITHLFQGKDILQILIGASILAVPVGFTEETWHLAEIMPITNIIILMLISMSFIAIFTHFHYYKKGVKGHRKEFFKRVISTYILSFIIVATLLTLILKAPWSTNFMLALKRTIIVTFPATMSAAIADVLK